MKIAVTYENGQVFQHFGHCKQFKVFDSATDSTSLLDAQGSGHGALAGFLQAHGIEVLICGGIGAGARDALAQAGIKLYPGVTGNADTAIQSFMAGTLIYDPDTHCQHHHDTACGEHTHGCGGHSI